MGKILSKSTNGSRISRNAEIMRMLDKGFRSKAEIAKMKGVHRTTVYRLAKSQGSNSAIARLGRPPKATMETISRIIKTAPRDLGFENIFWDRHSIVDALKQKAGLSISDLSIARILKALNLLEIDTSIPMEMRKERKSKLFIHAYVRKVDNERIVCGKTSGSRPRAFFLPVGSFDNMQLIECFLHGMRAEYPSRKIVFIYRQRALAPLKKTRLKGISVISV